MRKGMEHQVQAVEAGDMKGASQINKNEVKAHADKTFGELNALKLHQDDMAKNKVFISRLKISEHASFRFSRPGLLRWYHYCWE